VTSRREKLTILVTGYAATYPVGGATWDYLQYVLGFKRLGHRVYYLEDTGRWTWDVAKDAFSDDARSNAAYLAKWIAALDPELAHNWALRDVHGQYYGLSQAEVARLCRDVDVFINYSGSCILREEYLACRTKVYLDSDPLYNQAGILDYVHGTADEQTRWAVDGMRQHDKFVSFGESIGRPYCSIPTALFAWQPTRQPIVLDCWATSRAAVQTLELAIGGGLAPVDLLRQHGWHVINAYTVSHDPWEYREYICTSKAELSVAKQAYVATRSGWFSGRSACYLAAGRPVVVQDTGFSEHIPTGEGLLAFSTEDEALDAIERVNRDYQCHASAASRLARECFDSERVLQTLLETVLA